MRLGGEVSEAAIHLIHRLQTAERSLMPETLVIPGQYSGDMWHVAGALLVRPSLEAVITVLSPEDAEGAKVIQAFFEGIGLSDRVRVHTGKVGKLVKLGTAEYDVGDVPGKRLAWQHTASVQASLATNKQLVYPVYRSTAFIMRAMEERGKLKVLLLLRAGLTSNLPSATCKHIAQYVMELLSGFKNAKLLFVLGRIARYNPQHDLNVERMQEISRAAQRAKYRIVPVGAPPAVTKLCEEAEVETERCLDLRDWAALTGSAAVDERARAYFWRCVVDFAPKLGVTVKLVGGRSGSTDLPAFMGLEVLCWDVCDVMNPEYLRLLMTAPELLRVTHTGTDESRSAVTIAPETAPQFEEDVALFLSGAFAPPRLRFQVSRNAARKGAGSLASEKHKLLAAFERVCDCLFTSITTPLAFNTLNDTLRPESGEPNMDIADVSTFVAFQSEARAQQRTQALALAPSIRPEQALAELMKTDSSDEKDSGER